MSQKGSAERHPVRVLERAIGGGLGRGNLGVVLSRHGVGKTSFLIGLALDQLLQGRKVLHISTKESVERLVEFYEEMFQATADMLQLQDLATKQLDIERNRHILVYNRKSFTLEKLGESVSFLIDAAGFQPDMVIMDGTPRFEKCEEWEIAGLKDLARQWNAEIWSSSHTHREGQDADERGVPEPLARFDDYLSVLLNLEPAADHIRVRIAKEHGNEQVSNIHLELDPRTRLLRWR